MKTINERIEFLIREMKLKSIRDFDRAIGVSLGHTNNIVGAKQNSPNAEYLFKVKEKYKHINMNWLISGEGEIFEATEEEKMRIFEENKKLESEATNLRSQLSGLLMMASIVNQKSNFQTTNFKPVSNKKTPAKKRGTVTQLPLFARSVANSTWLRAL